MKKYMLRFILFSLLIGLSACGNEAVLPKDLESDSVASAPVESEVYSHPAEPPPQSVEPFSPPDDLGLPLDTWNIGSDTIVAFKENGLTGLLNIVTNEIVAEAVFHRIYNFSDGLARAERHFDVFYFNEEGVEITPTIPFVKSPEVEHPLANELYSIVSGFSWEFLFPEFEKLESMDFFSPQVSTNLFTSTLAEYGEIYGKLELPAITVRYEDMNTLGRLYFGDDFLFPDNLEALEVGPSGDDPTLFGFHQGRGGVPRLGYFLTDISEHEDTYTATFLPYQPDISWEDGTVIDIGFPLYPNNNTGRLEYPDKETRMGTATGDVDCFDYYRLLFPQELLGTITVTFQKADDGRMIAISSRYNRI